MKKTFMMLITTIILMIILSACSSEALPSQYIDNKTNDTGEIEASAATEQSTKPENISNQRREEAPILSYGSIEDALRDIKEVKNAGLEKEHDYIYDYVDIYDQDHMYVLKEVPPILGYELSSIWVGDHSIRMVYILDYEESSSAAFRWALGKDKETRIKVITENFYELEPYEDSIYYFGQTSSDVLVHWWENGDEFCFSYPADTGVLPEDVIEYLEVVRYDF